ncbi:helix-turn-helix transcriptional regulator [Nocardioides terrisoli]|uniref:helix-turn-helix transcriptional regulator n=1 Tax=Nocardioides terrisoli TaxID=3388267 RepID=UPI00287BB604|nr:LuxR C-terminal-related transcriptional regulator [Nocardioides marmorisolisilvae]
MRYREVKVIEGALAAVSGGTSKLVLVEGGMGSGKTALLAAAAEAATRLGLPVIHRRGDEFDLGSPIADLEPELHAHDGDVAIVLLVDDAHWIDSRSLLRLRRWVQDGPGHTCMVIAVRAAELVGTSERVIHELMVTSDAEAIELAPLCHDSAASLIAGIRGRPPSSEEARELCTRTGGNPFLLAAVAQADHTNACAEVPREIVRWVRTELTRQGDDAVVLARAVAVLGMHASLPHAARVARLSIEAAAEAADGLAVGEILAPPSAVGDRLDFVASVVREAVLVDMPPFGRAELHHRSAEVLHGEGAPAGDIATHLLSSVCRDDAWAAESLLSAGRQCNDAGEPTRAIDLLRRALAEPPPSALTAQVLLELGRAEALTGSVDAVQRLSRLIVGDFDPDIRRTAARLLGSYNFAAGQPAEAGRAFNQAVEEAAGAAPGGRGVEIDRLGALFFVTENRVAFDQDVRAILDSAREQGSAPEPGLLAIWACCLAVTRQDREAVRIAAEQAMAAGPLHGAPPWDCGFSWAVGSLVYSDHLSLARQVIDEVYADVGEEPPPATLGMLQMWQAMVAYHEGRLPEAAAYARAATDLARATGLHMWLPWSATYEVLCAIEADEPALAQRALDLAVDLDDTILGEACLLFARGRLQLESDDPIRALETFRATGRSLERSGLDDWPEVPWRLWAALAASETGADGEAAALAETELAAARRSGAPRLIGAALRAAGLVKGGGLDLLEEAVAVLEETSARLERVRARCDLGAALRTADRDAEATAMLMEALEEAEACGSRIVAARARRELRALGRRPRRAAVSGPASLTSAEARVATLAAQGLSNAAVAEVLSVSVRTVEWHLRSVFRKLGIRERSALGPVLRD